MAISASPPTLNQKLTSNAVLNPIFTLAHMLAKYDLERHERHLIATLILHLAQDVLNEEVL